MAVVFNNLFAENIINYLKQKLCSYLMFHRYLIIASKLDRAAVNITTQLSQFGKFNFYLVDKEVLNTENLDLDKINKYDFVIFASKHQSKEKRKTLSIHPPGNFRDADFGGVKGKVCKSSALFQKFIFEKLKEKKDEFHLDNYELTLEATHHGPLITLPCVFVEIGSTQEEWNDKKAAFVVAKAISEAIENFKKNEYHEVAIAIGGPHYCPSFNKIQLNSNIALSHVIPQYVFPLTEEMIKEAVEKTNETIDFVLIDWKGIGTADKRDEIINTLRKLYLPYKRTSDVEK